MNPKLAAYGKDIANNLLEFLAMAINLWLSIIECDDLGLKNELLLILGDNTSAIAWLFKSSVHRDSVYKEAVVFIARKVATLVLNSNHFIASQHVCGKLNKIADWLSFQGEERVENGEVKQNPVAYDCAPNDVVTNRIVSHFSQLVPIGFEISQLPPEIKSFAGSAMEIFESSLTRGRKGDPKPTTESGEDGNSSVWITSESRTQTLMEYPQRKSTSSQEHSLKCIGNPTSVREQEELLENVRSRWFTALSKKSHALWARRCGTISNSVRFTRKETEETK